MLKGSFWFSVHLCCKLFLADCFLQNVTSPGLLLVLADLDRLLFFTESFPMQADTTLTRLKLLFWCSPLIIRLLTAKQAVNELMSREGTLSNFSGTRVCMIETNKRLNSLSSQSGTFGEQRILNTYSNRSNIEHAHRNGCRCSCVSSFLLLLLCPLFSRLFLAAAGPGLILTLEQQSQVRRLSVVYFVSVCLL